MYQARRHQNTVAHGTAIAGEDIVKGRIVCVKNIDGVETAVYPRSDEDLDNMLGFAFLTIWSDEKPIKSHDKIKKGKKLTVYTLTVGGDLHATTEAKGLHVSGSDLPINGDLYTVGTAEGEEGMLIPATGDEKILFKTYQAHEANIAYNDRMLDVSVRKY